MGAAAAATATATTAAAAAATAATTTAAACNGFAKERGRLVKTEGIWALFRPRPNSNSEFGDCDDEFCLLV